MELLTNEEKEIIKDLGLINLRFGKICGKDPAVREQDYREFTSHIHDMQNAIMANAAARAYPKEFRLLGERIES